MTTKRKAYTQPNRLESQPKVEPAAVEVTSNFIETVKTETKLNPQYKILSEKNSFQTLQTEVESHLSEGWSLQGGVSVAMYSSPYETVTVFSQSLTKNI